MNKLPGKQIAPFETPSIGALARSDMTFHVGRIISVDEDRFSISVELTDRKGILKDIKLSQPYAGISSYIAMMPEIGSLVILANQDSFTWPIAYIPNYYAALEGLNIKMWPDSVKTRDKNEFFYRLKRLKKGEIAFASSSGSEIFLSDTIDMSDDEGDRVIIRGNDNTIASLCLSNYVFSGGVWQSSGLIRRNSMDDQKKEDGSYAVAETLNDGRLIYTLKPDQSDTSNKFFSEYLLEVADTTTGDGLDNDIIGSSPWKSKPVAVLALGNLVGNRVGKETYGKMLKARLFKDPNDRDGDFTLDTLTGQQPYDLGMAISLFKPDRRNPERGAFFGIDKEGHFYQYIPSATGGGLGKGRSMSIVARGNKKEIWGRDTQYGSSWDSTLSGGLRMVVGTHNDSVNNPYSGRSIDVRTEGTVFFYVGNNLPVDVYDFDDNKKLLDNLIRYKKIEKIGGGLRQEVDGTRETIVTSAEKQDFGSLLQRITGATTVSVGGTYNLSAEGANEKVANEKQEGYGSLKTTISKGDAELMVQSPVGFIKETIRFVGNKETTLTTGSIVEKILTVGSRTFKTTAGNFEVDTKVGNVIMNTKAGQVFVSTKTGAVSIKGFTSISIKTQKTSMVTIDGGSISLKGRTSSPAMDAGVITAKTHKDYITGAFLVGSSSVKASI